MQLRTDLSGKTKGKRSVKGVLLETSMCDVKDSVSVDGDFYASSCLWVSLVVSKENLFFIIIEVFG